MVWEAITGAAAALRDEVARSDGTFTRVDDSVGVWLSAEPGWLADLDSRGLLMPGIAVAYCVGMYLAYVFSRSGLLGRLVPPWGRAVARLEAKSPAAAAEFHQTLVCLLHSVCMSAGTLGRLAGLWGGLDGGTVASQFPDTVPWGADPDFAGDLTRVCRPHARILLALMQTYLAFDTVAMFAAGTLGPGFLVHHVAGMLSMGMCQLAGTGCGLYARFVWVAEISTPLMHVRWFVTKLGGEGSLADACCAAGFAVLFLWSRGFYMMPFYRLGVSDDITKLMPGVPIISGIQRLSICIFAALNMAWGGLIVQAGLEMVGILPRSKDKAE